MADLLSEYTAECMAYIGRTEHSLAHMRARGEEPFCVFVHPDAAQFVKEETGLSLSEIWGVSLVLTRENDLGETLVLDFDSCMRAMAGEELEFYHPGFD